MLKNYLTIAFRNLRRHPGFTAINVVGLAGGLAVCSLIALYVQHEWSYDDHFASLHDAIEPLALPLRPTTGDGERSGHQCGPEGSDHGIAP